jgi:glycosyltransferase involved in cell wall biosynthesis
MHVEFSEQPDESHAAELVGPVHRAPRPEASGLIVALIPAHNAGDRVGAAIRSLDEQSSAPDLTIVCADSWTDLSVLAAETAGADVFVTVRNEHGRAGALNQALNHLLPALRDEDAILIMDAKSSLNRDFVGEARRRLSTGAGGVGAAFNGLEGGGFFGLIENSDYARYGREFRRLPERPGVLNGKASLYRAKALQHVFIARCAGMLPGLAGARVFDTNATSAEGELTLALAHLGYKTTVVH